MKLDMIRIALFFLVLLVSQTWGDDDQPVVKTKLGEIRGYIQPSSKGHDFYTFLGIPYGQPPVGPLRFKPPLASEPWDDIRDGTKEAPFCLHYDYVQAKRTMGKEDCLYLNVYTRKLPTEDHNPSLPVMFWIHGGGFSFGSGSPIFWGPQYMLNHDIVLVAINYRLSSFGFLSTGDEACPGNMGLKDQNLALSWVRDNIASFGGDPNRVTIFGESAGSASVHYHMMSPMSRGLFHGAISQSGTALCSWAWLPPSETLSRARRLGAVVGCKQDKTDDLIDCLRTIQGSKLAQAHLRLVEWYLDPVVLFGPTTELAGDHKFLSNYPYDQLVSGDVAPVPWMTGFCDLEAEMMIAGILADKNLKKQVNQEHRRIFPLIMAYRHLTDQNDYVSDEVWRTFVGEGKNISMENRASFIEGYSDRFMNHGIIKTVKIQAATASAPIYFYQLTFKGQSSFSKILGKSQYDPIGVAHADDLLYLFPLMIFPPLKEGTQEMRMMEMMTAWWTNFAYTGNPTPPGGKESSVTWEPLRKDVLNHLNMNLEPHMQTEYPEERIQFWDNMPLNEHERYKPASKNEKDEL